MTKLPAAPARHRHFFCALAMSATMLLQACAQPQLSQSYEDAEDVCNPQRRSLVNLETTEQQELLQSVAETAAVGAIVGGIGGLIVGRDLESAAIGAGIGALAGGLGGYTKAYFDQKAQEAETREQLLNAVDADASQERRVLTRTASAVEALRNCRNAELGQIERRIRSGDLRQDAARAEVVALQKRVDVDNRLVSEVLDGADERVTAYVDTTAAATGGDSALLAADRRDAEARRARSQVSSSSGNVIGAEDQLNDLRTDEAQREEVVDDRIAAMLIQIG